MKIGNTRAEIEMYHDVDIHRCIDQMPCKIPFYLKTYIFIIY